MDGLRRERWVEVMKKPLLELEANVKRRERRGLFGYVMFRDVYLTLGNADLAA